MLNALESDNNMGNTHAIFKSMFEVLNSACGTLAPFWKSSITSGVWSFTVRLDSMELKNPCMLRTYCQCLLGVILHYCVLSATPQNFLVTFSSINLQQYSIILQLFMNVYIFLQLRTISTMTTIALIRYYLTILEKNYIF